MDRQSALLLPPVHRPYQTFSISKISSTQSIFSTGDQSSNALEAYHIGCFSDDAQTSILIAVSQGVVAELGNRKIEINTSDDV